MDLFDFLFLVIVMGLVGCLGVGIAAVIREWTDHGFHD